MTNSLIFVKCVHCDHTFTCSDQVFFLKLEVSCEGCDRFFTPDIVIPSYTYQQPEDETD